MIRKITNEKLRALFKEWSEDHRVMVPDERGRLVEYSEDIDICWDTVPVWGGVKEFVFPARNLVAGIEEEDTLQIILVGIRSCDIRALKGVFDRVFLEEEPVDTVYKNFRENLKLVTVDCASPADTCFCAAVGGEPYCEKGFDINLAFTDDGIVIETGSEAGEKMTGSLGENEANREDIEKRNDLRDTSSRKVRQNLKLDHDKDGMGEKVAGNNSADYWEEKSEKCMQCGGCNFVCPTCYCNVLNEISGKKEIKKVLQWDSCHFPGYARVGGGANPRQELWQRFRNRYLCKFSLMQNEFDMSGCTGCGRCIQTCPGKIDIRETLKGLYD
ncbi:MAG: 4Fe-4S dicluster domain-containing protein [Elusimicrobiota bacterium]